MAEFTCSTCDEVFASKAKRNTHFLDCAHRKEHLLAINGKQVTVHRTIVDHEQYWRCLCGGVSCKKNYAKWNTLKKHILTTQPITWDIAVSLQLYCRSFI